MQYKQLGNSGIAVSVIGFGCMSLGKEQQQNTHLIDLAIEQGINFFDTADLYDKGWNEESVGIAIKPHRSRIVLATKAGNQWRPDGSGWDWNASKQYILAAIDKSLQRLQTDHIDLYQLHGGMLTDPIDETIEAFEQLRAQGKIRAYGISSIRPNVIREYVRRSSISSVMMQYSLLDRRPEEECLSLLLQNNIAVLSRGALAQGLLAGKPAKEYLGNSKEVTQAVATAVKKAGINSPAQNAIQFVLQQPAITSVVAGIRNATQLLEITDAARLPLLPDEAIAQLRDIAIPQKYTDHR